MSDPDAQLGFEKPVDYQNEVGKGPEEVSERQWDPAFVRKTMLKMDLLIMPCVTLLYLFSSLDKSNLGNAKQLGMINDLGKDPTGKTYALLNSLYFVGYAPFMIPLALFGKRTRVSKMIAGAGLLWGTAATCFAAVDNFPGAYACRFFVGLGEAGFAPLIPVYLARWYTKKDLATRVAFWLCAAPLGGFVNGIVAYGVSFIDSHIENWRILFLLEGLLTVTIATYSMVVMPEDIQTSRWFSAEQKEFLLVRRAREMSTESNAINWKHARGALYRWQSLIPVVINSSQNISGAALSAFLPTFTSDAGFKGANAQIATLAPYGSAAVVLLAFSYWSDRVRNRGWFVQAGFFMLVVGFAIYLGVDPSAHAAKIVALILAEVGHYVITGLVMVWQASNSGSESRRAVGVPLAVSVSQAVAIGSGYLFPAPEGPKYTRGSAVIMGLGIFGSIVTFAYQYLLTRENKKRDEREGVPDGSLNPDTQTYADDAPGFRYQL